MTPRPVRFFLALAACATGSMPAGAQDKPPQVVDLPAIVRLVRDASPRLAVERQDRKSVV